MCYWNADIKKVKIMELALMTSHRSLKTEHISCDFVVVGGGLAGVCAAISAARRGIQVCLIQDRPVLGGNASSEIRVWALGATSHMGNNNRFSREGGVIDEILTENMYRNKEGNPILFDMVLMDKVLAEKNIRLLLNTAVFDLSRKDRRITGVVAFCSSSETRYEVTGKYFADCTGDGTVSYLAGVTYRMGAEDKETYGEGFAPDTDKYGELMGHTIFFYMKDVGYPVRYVAPDFALKNVEGQISKISNTNYFNTGHHGCKYWWLEWGGRLDTVHDTEGIKRELWKVVYGLWDYIKNSGKFPEMENYTLEWVATIPGKRESRRMKGLYTLTQNDIVAQKHHDDAVSYGGWAVDLHPADGVYAPGSACNQWHSKGVYQIPYRCFVGDEIDNLFFGGRIISASHVANGSTRVMCTSAHGGAVIGEAAALCLKHDSPVSFYADKDNVKELRLALEERGHFVPGFCETDTENLLNTADVSASSVWKFMGFEATEYRVLEHSAALMLPVSGKLPAFTVSLEADEDTAITVSVRVSDKSQNYTPERTLASIELNVKSGRSVYNIDFGVELPQMENVFITFSKNSKVKIGVTDRLAAGVTTVFNQINEAVSNYGRQEASENSGFESFEFWCPLRRPYSYNLALQFSEPMELFSVDGLKNAYKRPYIGTNAWSADPQDKNPQVSVSWKDVQEIKRVVLFFDNDHDQAMEPIQHGHYDNIMPQCVRSYRIYDASGCIVYESKENHLGVNEIKFSAPVYTDKLSIELDHAPQASATLFHIILK